MLKPLITGFLDLYLIDFLPVNALFAGGAFVWDMHVPGLSEDRLHAMHGAEFWQYWVQFAAGAVLACVLRLLTLRTWRARTLSGQQRSILGLHVLPYGSHAVSVAYHGVLIAAAAFLAMFMYRHRLHDPASALGEPFSVGILVSLVGVWCVLLAAEIAEYYIGVAGEPHASHLSVLDSRNVAAALVVAALMALDLLAFEHGPWLVLLVSGGVAAAWLGSVVLQRIPRVLRTAVTAVQSSSGKRTE